MRRMTIGWKDSVRLRLSLSISPSYLPILSLCLSLKSQLCRSFCFKSRLVTTFLFIYFDFDFDWISAKEANGRICLPARSHPACACASLSSPSDWLWCRVVDLAHLRARFAPKKFVANFLLFFTFFLVFFFVFLTSLSCLAVLRGLPELLRTASEAYKYSNGSCLAWKIIVKQSKPTCLAVQSGSASIINHHSSS